MIRVSNMYIRTKDGIYKVEGETCHKKAYFIDRYEEDVILKKRVINQSENIEELCDEFVGYFECFNRSYYFIYKNSYDEVKSNVQTFSPNRSAYGAIWTSKGLIFVAKMNDKGDLELI